MVKELLIRSLQILACAILFSGGAVANLRAEPITVTSGVFVISDDDPNFFRFFGANGFALHGGFVPVPASPKATCDFPLPGCLPGTSLNLSPSPAVPSCRSEARSHSGMDSTQTSMARHSSNFLGQRDHSSARFTSMRLQWCSPLYRKGLWQGRISRRPFCSVGT